MSRSQILDAERCLKTDKAGRRCTRHRLPGGDHTLCYHHWNSATSGSHRPGAAVHPLLLATRLMPAESTLDSPDAVKNLLTGVMREVLEGNLTTRQAGAIGYLGQPVLLSLQHIQKAPPPPAHPLFSPDPDAAIEDLARTCNPSSRRMRLRPRTRQIHHPQERPVIRPAAAVAMFRWQIRRGDLCRFHHLNA